MCLRLIECNLDDVVGWLKSKGSDQDVCDKLAYNSAACQDILNFIGYALSASDNLGGRRK